MHVFIFFDSGSVGDKLIWFFFCIPDKYIAHRVFSEHCYIYGREQQKEASGRGACSSASVVGKTTPISDMALFLVVG
jgi:hypothetical protein